MPHAQIQAASYAGNRRDSKYQKDAWDLACPLDAQVMEALHFVRRNMLIQATTADGPRWCCARRYKTSWNTPQGAPRRGENLISPALQRRVP
jgi:hypothetical protein